MKQETIRFILVISLIAAAAAATVFVLWAQDSLAPTSEAVAALRVDDQVKVTEEAGSVIFEPIGISSVTGLIFYPGGRIEHRAYAPVLRRIAARGYFVVLLSMPLNLAILNTNAADRVVAEYPQIAHWAVGGHSLGGVAAASYVSRHPRIEGMVLWAAYPASDSLKSREISVVSVYGSEDQLASLKEIEASRLLLPSDTIFIEIRGGNHSQFGSYGLQPGDGRASISPEQQWEQVADATAALLDMISNEDETWNYSPWRNRTGF